LQQKAASAETAFDGSQEVHERGKRLTR